MKNIIYVFALIIFCASTSFAQTAPVAVAKTTKVAEREKFDPTRVAADDLKAAVAKAAKENKRIILDVGGEWCSWCRLMDNYFAKNVELTKLREDNFVWLKVNFSPENENKEFLASYPEVKGYPHLFVLEKDGELLHSQDTSALEEGKGYNLKIFTEFLQKWSPAKSEDK
ncbi:MAG: thioredoxin family protein [Pyrinomonadaceae bacterium]|nr:thioredoxin family protein [Pyrinomonadaceae bacterium]